MNDKELRYVNINPNNFLKIEKTSHVEKRADGTEETVEESKMVLEGYPIVFDQETLIGDEQTGWIEVIRKEAMNGADMSDTPLKYNHQDITPILARVRNGSLKLTVDDHGVFMRAELLDTQQNKDFYKMVKAGLLDKMSFAFNVIKENFDKLSKPARREILGIGRLFDVSIVDVPAYDGTSLQARSKAIAEARAEAEAEAEARALEELENSNIELEMFEARRRRKQFEFEKRKKVILLKLYSETRTSQSESDLKKKLANLRKEKLELSKKIDKYNDIILPDLFRAYKLSDADFKAWQSQTIKSENNLKELKSELAEFNKLKKLNKLSEEEFKKQSSSLEKKIAGELENIKKFKNLEDKYYKISVSKLKEYNDANTEYQKFIKEFNSKKEELKKLNSELKNYK